MKYLRYKGEFVSVDGAIWRAEILQEADSAFTVVGDLDFPADEPLVIEWQGKSKDEVICGSIATLQITSPGDRTYEDLYSIEVGRVRLDVYRNGSLYWSGCLDTEFYEEPYEKLQDYEVSLTFSDFGVLDRLNYDLSDYQTLRDIAEYCVDRAGINYTGIDESLISTQKGASDTAAMGLDALMVRSDNFYDEDGEALTLAKVLEGILQPLALRIVQRLGKIYVYDLNGLYSKASVKPITWDGSSQTLGVDAVYNNAKVTWSPYAQSGDLLPEECWGDIEVDPNLMALNILAGLQKNGATYYSYHYSTDIKDWIDATDCGFTIWTAPGGKNIEILDALGGCRFYKIVPQYDGTESEGIALAWWSYRGLGSGSSYYCEGSSHGTNVYIPTVTSVNTLEDALFRTGQMWIPPVANAGGLNLRVCMDLLVDPRFNPFESAANIGSFKQKDWYEEFERNGNFVYVPVVIKFQPEGSTTVYVWTNRSVVTKPVSTPVRTLDESKGSWVVDTGTTDTPSEWGYLCYYDAQDRDGTSGALGWKTNRQAINPHKQELVSVMVNADAGQYIPYPNFGGKGGKVWIEVRRGWYLVNDSTDLDEAENKFGEWNGRISWILAQAPGIEIINNTQFELDIDTSDVEYSAEINAAAKEPIEKETICGTSAEGVPTARGAYFDSQTGAQITQLTRAGRTTQVEDLLIGTLYSQYAARKTKLIGEAQITADAVAAYSEANQGDKRFILVEDVQNAIAGTSEVTIIELRPDEYTKRN